MTAVPTVRAPRRAVVFDLDDTLYPERRFALSGFRSAAEAVASTFACDARFVLSVLVRSYRRGLRQEAFQAACRDARLPPEAVTTMLGAYRSHTPRLVLPRESRLTLERCREMGAVAILTNGDPNVQRAKVRALGVEALVDAVVYAAEHHVDGKPAVEAFRAVERVLNVEARACLMVGDTWEKDVVGALSAGWRSVWKRTRRAASCGDVPERVAVVTRLAELPQVAEKILQEGFVGYEHAHRTTAGWRG